MTTKNTLNLYEMSPVIYDSYISMNIEKNNFSEVFKHIIKYKNKKGATSILDLCCGTGTFPYKWLLKLKNINYVGVDINKNFLDFAKKRFKNNKNYKFIKSDASSVKIDKKFDIITATSSYHHIKDNQKIKFLKNIHKHLRNNGVVIVYEKFVAPFSNKQEAIKSGTEFYSKRIYYINQREKLKPEQIFALYNEMYLTAIRETEYKVTLKHFLSELKQTKFKVISKTKLWPKNKIFKNNNVGDFVISFKKI